MSTTAADGSHNVTVVDGTTYVGLIASDGSANVVISNTEEYAGAVHACGAMNVTVVTEEKEDMAYRAPNGSVYVSESPYFTGTLKVTVVSGTLTPDPEV